MAIQIEFEDSSKIWVDLPLVKFSFTDRVKRAVKTFTVLLAAAVFSILIPVLHFVLVPGFFISAFVMSILRFNQVSYIELNNFKCPKCSELLTEKKIFQSKKEGLSKIYCLNCRTNMKMEVI